MRHRRPFYWRVARLQTPLRDGAGARRVRDAAFLFVSRANDGGRSIARSARTGERATGDWRLASGEWRRMAADATRRNGRGRRGGQTAATGRTRASRNATQASRPPRHPPAARSAGGRRGIQIRGPTYARRAHPPRLASTHRATRLDSTRLDHVVTGKLGRAAAARIDETESPRRS